MANSCSSNNNESQNNKKNYLNKVLPGVSLNILFSIKLTLFVLFNLFYFQKNIRKNSSKTSSVALDYNILIGAFILSSLIILAISISKEYLPEIHLFYLLYFILTLYYIFYNIIIRNNLNQTSNNVIIFKKFFFNNKRFQAGIILLYIFIVIFDLAKEPNSEEKILNKISFSNEKKSIKSLKFIDFCLNILIIIYFIFFGIAGINKKEPKTE